MSNIVQLCAKTNRLKRMRKTVLNSARHLMTREQENGFRPRVLMYTLTYRSERSWEPNHIRQFTHRLREHYARRKEKLSYVWVAELQQRGAVHYHVLVWLPKGMHIPMPDKKGWWTHGLTRTEITRHAAGYIAKYASKGGSSVRFPTGCRINASAGLNDHERAQNRWWLLPLYVRQHFVNFTFSVERVPNGFACVTTGEFLQSEWQYFGYGRDGPYFTKRASADQVQEN